MPSRQQKRARARAPQRSKRQGSKAFIAVIVILMLAGVGAVATFVLNPGLRPTATRGAIVGEHWHAKYRFEICGKTLDPYPFVEGEIHTHGDGQVHLHPHTQAFANENANFGSFLNVVETGVIQDDEGKRTIFLPDGSKYSDGDECPDSGEAHEVEVLLNGDAVTEDPMKVVLHEGDEIVVRFGPRATAKTANPYRPPGAQQIQVPPGAGGPPGDAPPGADQAPDGGDQAPAEDSG